MWIIIYYKDVLLVCISQPSLTSSFILYLKSLSWWKFCQYLCLERKIRWNLSRKKKNKKKTPNVLKVHSANKLLTSSKRRFLPLPTCVSTQLVTCFKGASQALAMPTAHRTGQGTQHSMQVINPQVCTLVITADASQEDAVLQGIGPFLISERTLPDLKQHIHLRLPIPGMGRTSRDLHVTCLPQYLFS